MSTFLTPLATRSTTKNEISLPKRRQQSPEETHNSPKMHIMIQETETSYDFTKDCGRTTINAPKQGGRNTKRTFKGTQAETYASLADKRSTDRCCKLTKTKRKLVGLPNNQKLGATYDHHFETQQGLLKVVHTLTFS